MTFPNLDNTFLASLQLYRRLRAGKWYLRHYNSSFYVKEGPTDSDDSVFYPGQGDWEVWGRYGGKSPMSYVVKSEDYTPPPPFIAGLGGTLIDGKW